ncbi:hypothetical protein N7536_012103 [Penicillium majusculum]|nr:hypothetical protein N7536_012103 [Penicillium majusculum]
MHPPDLNGANSVAFLFALVPSTRERRAAPCNVIIALPSLKHKTDKEPVADQRPIPTPDDTQLELFTQLPVRGAARTIAIRLAIREATGGMAQLDALLLISEATSETNPGIVVIRQLEHIMVRLMCRLMEIRRERDRDQAIEQDLWCEVTG